MKSVFGAAAGFALAVAIVGSAQAHIVFIPHGTTSGPVVVNNPTVPTPTTGIFNHGTITGGTSPGITVTGPVPVTIVNTGTITSNTVGITVTGSSSSITNTGSIVVTSGGGGSSSAVGISMGGH